MAAILAALYLVLMVESMAAGVALYYVIQTAVDLTAIPVKDRELQTVLLLAFWTVTLSGYLISLPCFSYALHKRHGKWLYPYMIWRILLILLILAIAIYICVKYSEKEEVEVDFFLKLLLPVTVAVVMGAIFFWFAFSGMRFFARYRITTVDRLIS